MVVSAFAPALSGTGIIPAALDVSAVRRFDWSELVAVDGH
jgi:hypothetical protein